MSNPLIQRIQATFYKRKKRLQQHMENRLMGEEIQFEPLMDSSPQSDSPQEGNRPFPKITPTPFAQLKHNKTYRSRLISISAIVLLVILATVFGVQRSLSNQYQEAVTNAIQGEYAASLELLDSLGTYKDSEALVDYLSTKQGFQADVRNTYAQTLNSLSHLEQSYENPEKTLFSDTPDILADFTQFKSNVETLEQEYRLDLAAAETIASTIDTLPDGSQLHHAKNIRQARQQYDTAPDAVKTLVKNHTDLVDAEQQVADTLQYHETCKAEAKDFDQVLQAIGTVSLDSKEKLEKTRTAYNGLSKETQQYLQHYSLLEKAETKYTQLKEAKAEEERLAKEEKARMEREEKERLAREQEEAEKQALELEKQKAYEEEHDSYANTVYWTPNGKKYHLSKNCRTLKRSKTIYSGSISESGRSDDCNVCS